MGLATPTSILVGTGRAARQGILFRRGEALQALGGRAHRRLRQDGDADHRPPRAGRDPSRTGFDTDERAASGRLRRARSSEHPIAHALVEAAKARGLALAPVRSAEALPGFGLRAEVEGRRVEIGARRFMERLGLDPAPFDAESTALAQGGATPLFLALDGQLAALLAVSDPIREDAAEAVAALKREGLRTALVSGDDRRTAEAVARRLGIDETVAEVLPEGKVEAIRRLQRDHGPVLFVGDGINDAPALAAAEIGMAIGSGTDVAIEAADVVLVAPSPGNVPRAIALSRSVLATSPESRLGLRLQCAADPGRRRRTVSAFGLLLSPVWGGTAMGLSSTLVLLNGLRSGRCV